MFLSLSGCPKRDIGDITHYQLAGTGGNLFFNQVGIKNKVMLATLVGTNVMNCLSTIFCTLRKNVVLPSPARPVRKKRLLELATARMRASVADSVCLYVSIPYLSLFDCKEDLCETCVVIAVEETLISFLYESLALSLCFFWFWQNRAALIL